MKIQYHINEKEFIKYQTINHIQKLRKKIISRLVIVPIMILGFLIISLLTKLGSLTLSVRLIAHIFLYVFIFVAFYLYSLRRGFKKIYKLIVINDLNNSFVDFTDTGIIIYNDSSRNENSWEKVESIITSKEHITITFTNTAIFIMPKKLFLNNDLEDFYKIIRKNNL